MILRANIRKLHSMFRKITLTLLCFSCIGAMDQTYKDADTLINLINIKNLAGVKKILDKNPDLVTIRLPGYEESPLEVAIINMLFSTNSEKEAFKSIVKELLDSKNVDINTLVGRRYLPVLAFLLSATIPDSYKNITCAYHRLMYQQDVVALFLKKPKVDVTLKYNDMGCQKNVLDVLDEYRKFDQKYYGDLLKLFVNLEESNEKSWNAVFGRMLELGDMDVLKTMYQKLQNQQWFRGNSVYLVFDLFCNWIEQRMVPPRVARSLRLKWAGKDGNILRKAKLIDIANKVNNTYEYLQEKKLKKLELILIDHIQVADMVCHKKLQNMGSLVARY